MSRPRSHGRRQFRLGLDDDGPDVFERTVEWGVSRSLETATFHIMTPYPGTALHQRLVADDRIVTNDWERYDTRHVVFTPKRMTPEQLEAGSGAPTGTSTAGGHWGGPPGRTLRTPGLGTWPMPAGGGIENRCQYSSSAVVTSTRCCPRWSGRSMPSSVRDGRATDRRGSKACAGEPFLDGLVSLRPEGHRRTKGDHVIAAVSFFWWLSLFFVLWVVFLTMAIWVPDYTHKGAQSLAVGSAHCMLEQITVVRWCCCFRSAPRVMLPRRSVRFRT